MGDGYVEGDTVQPGGEFGAGFVIVGEGAPELDGDFLSEVLTIFFVAGEGGGEAIDDAAVLLEEGLKAFLISRTGHLHYDSHDGGEKSQAGAGFSSGELAEAFEGVDIAAGFVVGLDGGFEDKGLVAELGVREDAVEGGFADLAFADVFVAVEMGGECAFGIVGVDDFDEIETESFVGGGDGFFETGGVCNVEAGGEEVAGIEAVADVEVGLASGEIANDAELFKATADLVAAADGVFEEHGEGRGAEPGGSFGEAEGEGGEALFEGLTFEVAGVEDEVIGGYDFGAIEFAAEGGDGFGADFGIERGEVDQIVGVDDERREVQALAEGGEAGGVGGVGFRGAPHAGTCGEYLEGVGAEAVGFEAGDFQGFGGGGVESDSQERL